MKVSVLNMFGTSAVALLAVAGTPASAQVSTTANGPYYATPSWDQKLTTNRFVILANWNGEAVLDRETGLVWERLPSPTQRDWYAATTHCLFKKVGGRAGWRMPRFPELFSLGESDGISLTLPVGHPFGNLVPSFYWSATSSATVSLSALTWLYDTPFGFPLAKDDNSARVWCVRGAQGGDAD
jgi:hypothetical protein